MNKQAYIADLLSRRGVRSRHQFDNTEEEFVWKRRRPMASPRNLFALDLPNEQEHPDAAKAHMKAAERARSVDHESASALYAVINGLHERSEFRDQIGVLAERLDPDMRDLFDDGTEFHPTLASSCYLTDVAHRVGLAADTMIGQNKAEYSIVLMSSASWRFSPEQLSDLSLVELVDEVYDTFEFLRIDKDCGNLLAFVHVYFDPLNREFALSFRGLADQPMASAIEHLRHFPRFNSRLEAGSQITIYPLAEHALPLSALVQTDWPVRVRYVEEGKPRFVEFSGGIAHPYLAPSLVWRDRWDLDQATLMIGFHVTDDRLIPQVPCA